MSAFTRATKARTPEDKGDSAASGVGGVTGQGVRAYFFLVAFFAAALLGAAAGFPAFRYL